MFRKKSVLANVLIISMLISTFAFGYTPYEAHGATGTRLFIYEGHNDVSTSYCTEISTDFGKGYMSSSKPYVNMDDTGTYSLVDGKLTDGNGHYLELTTGEITGFCFGSGGAGSCTKNAQKWANSTLTLTVKKTHTKIQIDKIYNNSVSVSINTVYNRISTDKGEAYGSGSYSTSYYVDMFDSGKYSIVNGRLEDGNGHYFMMKGYEITGFCFGTASSGDDCTRNSKQFSNSKISIKTQPSHAYNNLYLYEGGYDRTSMHINKVSTDYGAAETGTFTRAYLYSSGTYKIDNGKLTDGNGHYLEVDGYEITGFNFGSNAFTTDPKMWISGNLYIEIQQIYTANNMYLFNTSGTSMNITSLYNLISTEKGAAYNSGSYYRVDMFNSGTYSIVNGRLENGSGHYLEMDGYEITGFCFSSSSYSNCNNTPKDYSGNTIALTVKQIYPKMQLYVYSGGSTYNVANTYFNKISTDKGAAYNSGTNYYVDMFNSGTYSIVNGRLENESGHYLEVDGCEIIGFGFGSSSSSCTSEGKSFTGSSLSIKVQETYSQTKIQGIYEGTSTSTMQTQNILAYISTDKGAAYNSGTNYYVDMFNSGTYSIVNGRLQNESGHYLEMDGYEITGFCFSSSSYSNCNNTPKAYSSGGICLKVEKTYTGTMIRVYGETGTSDMTVDFYNKISTEKGAAYNSGSYYNVEMFCSGTYSIVNGRLENGGHYLEVDGCEITSFVFGGSYSDCTPNDKEWASGTLNIRIKEIYKKTRIYSIYHNGGADKRDLYCSLVSTDHGNAYNNNYVDMYIGTEYKLENGRLADGSGHYLQLDGYNILGFCFNSSYNLSDYTSDSKIYTGSGDISLNVQPSCDKTQLFIYENGVNSDKASTYYNKISTDVAKAYVNSSLYYADMYVSGTYSIVDGKLTDGKGHYLEIDGAKIIGFYFGGSGVGNCTTSSKMWQNTLAINIGLPYKISYTGMSGATHGTDHPVTVYTSEIFNVSNPTKSGYHFNGWNITGMSSGSHTVGGTTVSGTSKDNVKDTSFKDLNSDGNTVTFEATWLEDLIKPSPTTASVSRTYNGSSQTINFSTPSHTTRGGTYQATDAGTYTATYTPDTGYCWSDGTTGAVNVDWQILKVAATVTTLPVLASSKTYTGSAQDLLSNAGATSTGTLKYCVTTSTSTPADGSFGTTYSATTPGTYYVWYYVEGDSNHNDTTKTNLGPVTIDKATPTVTPPVLKTGNQEYRGTPIEACETLGSTTVGTLEYCLTTDNSATAPTGGWSSAEPVASAVGTYYLWYRVIGDSNYNDVNAAKLSSTLKVEFGKFTLQYELAGGTGVSDDSVDYDKVGKVTTAEPTKSGFIFRRWNTSADGSGSDVAAETVWHQANAASQEYDVLYAIYDKYVDKPTTPSSVVYNGTVQTIAVTTPAGISADGDITATNVGEYTVIYTPGDGYCWSDGEKTPVEIKWKIIKADNPIASPADQTWDAGFSADAQTKELQGFTSAEGNVSYTISGDSHFSISGNILTMQGSTPLGSYELTVTGTTTGNENYESATKTFNVGITVTDKSAPTDISIISTDLNDDSQTVKFSGNDDIGITKYYFGTSDNSAPNKEWTDNNEETVSAGGIYYLVVQDDAGNKSSANITFYLTTFSVTNGSVDISKILKESGKNIELPAITANTGYTAPDKWSNGVEPYHSYMVTADAALTAVCTENTYNLVYELDGGTGDSSSSAKYTEEGRVTNTPPTKACHTFIEWNTQANGEGQTVSADAIWKNADSVSLIYDKLYAIWDENNPTVSAEPTIKESMVYTSLGNVLITPAEVVNGTSYYAIGTDGTTVPSAEAWSTDIPRKVDAGTYHVWWMVSGDADYLDVPPKYIGEATIARLTLTNSNFNFNGSFTYDGTAHEISGGSIAFDCSNVHITIYDLMISSYEDNVNAGKHKAYVALTPNGPNVHNYIIESGTYISFTIKKAEQTITANDEQIFTYGDMGKSISASAEGTLSYTVVSGDSVTVDEATGALDILKTGDTKVKISAEATPNYEAASKEITVKIQTSKISKPSADATEFTYTGSELTYQPGGFDSSKMEISGDKNTNAGTYQVTVTPKSGYEWSDAGDCTFEWVIKKAEQTITADALQGFLTSDTNAYVVASAEGTLSYTVVSGDSVTVNSNTGKLTISHTGETTIKISADATTNYNETSKQIKVRIVAEKLEKPSADAREFIYTGSELTYQPDGFDSSKMEISGNAKTNAGTYEVTVTPKPDYAWNEPGDCTFEWVIKKAEQTITADELQTFTYGDTGESISSEAEGTLSYTVVSGDSVTVDETTGALNILKTGDTKINISAEATSNYNAVSKEITVRIQTSKISKPSADATEFTYTGSELTYQPGGFDDSKMEISGNRNTNAGTYQVTVTPKSGYEWNDTGDCTFTWVINRAEQTITADDEQTFTYGDTGKSISASAEGTLSYTVVSGDSVTVNPNTGELTINHTGETKVNISAEATSNYKAVSKEITITIQRAEQTITAEDPQNFALGDSNPQLIASAEGTISYEKVSGDAIVVSSNGELTIISTGDAVVRVTAAETQNYNSKSIEITVRISTSVSHVTLNTNEGECAPLTTYIEGTETTLPVPTREGYDFNGWFTNAECTGNAVTQIEATDTGDLEFWAKWTAKTFTIANATPEESAASCNGYLEMSSSALYRSMVTVKVFPNSGYELESLQYTASDDSVQTIEKTANEYTFEMPAKDITVSATFKEKQVPGSSGNSSTTDQTTDPQNNVDTASVTIGNMSIQVDMLVENGIANISEIGKEDIEKALRTADKISNINTLNIEIKNNEVIGVKFTVSTLKNIVEILESKENSINAFEIGMQEAIVKLDSKAIKSIKEQAVGDYAIIALTETNEEDLTSEQKQALAKREVYKTFDVRAESDGTTIHNFNGGKAIVELKYSPEQGREGKNYKIYYANDGGKLQKMATKYANGTIKFATTHFSDFAIAYDPTQEILLLQSNAKGKNEVKLSWNKISNAKKYVVYGVRCGNKYKKLKTLTRNTYTVKQISGKKLIAHKYYKFYVKAYDDIGNKYRSRRIHTLTGNIGYVYANVKSIKAKKSKYNLKVGKSKKISAEYKMYYGMKHIKNTHGVALKYYSGNPEIAKVNSKGKVTALSPGTATIYIQDIGGKYCKTKVIVKK